MSCFVLPYSHSEFLNYVALCFVMSVFFTQSFALCPASSRASQRLRLKFLSILTPLSPTATSPEIRICIVVWGKDRPGPPNRRGRMMHIYFVLLPPAPLPPASFWTEAKSRSSTSVRGSKLAVCMLMQSAISSLSSILFRNFPTVTTSASATSCLRGEGLDTATPFSEKPFKDGPR